MKHILKIGFVLPALLVMGACATRVHVVDLEGISMKKRHVAKNAKLKSMGEQTSTYCTENKMGDGSRIGLIDEAVKSMEQQYNAEVIKHVSIYRRANCIEITGEPMQLAERQTQKGKKKMKRKQRRGNNS